MRCIIVRFSKLKYICHRILTNDVITNVLN